MTAISVEQDSTARALVLDAPRVLLVINAAALAKNETVNASASIMSNMNMVFAPCFVLTPHIRHWARRHDDLGLGPRVLGV